MIATERLKELLSYDPREATVSQNHANVKAYSNNKVGFKGVHQRYGKFVAQIVKNGKTTYLGSFDTAADAHDVYVAASKKLHGEFSRGE